VQVTRSWIGVPVGDNGTAAWAGSGGGRVYIAATGAARIGTHEAGHVQETKKIHDAKITPLEARVKDQKTAPSAAAGEAAVKAHVNWNATLTSFATDDIAMNGAGGTFDTTDQAKADFYHDKGPKKVGTVNYQHYIEAP
jgi:hypothetical protein